MGTWRVADAVVYLPSPVWLFSAPWTAACQTSLSLTNSEFAQVHVRWVELVISSNHLILCRPFLLLSSIFPSIRVFSIELALPIKWLKYWSFNISPSNEYLGLISFKIDWFDLFVVQGTLKSLLQHHSSKASVLQCSASLSALLLYGPALTCMHDYWKDHSLDYTDLWWMCREALIYCWKKYQIAYPLGEKAHGS